ncbi:unnamed protein product [Scytosiphon promiscuus]
MYIRPLLLPAAASLTRVLEVRGFAFASGTARGVRQLSSSSRSLPSALGCPASLESPTATSTRRSALPQQKSTAASRALLLSNRARGGVKLSRNMATKSAAAESGVILDLSTPQEVLEFWFGTDPARLTTDEKYGQSFGAKWFGLGPPDQAFLDTQSASKDLIHKAANDKLQGEEWDSPAGALAKLVLLDQFPRTAYRGTAQAFANDEKAASLSLEVISKGWDAMDAGNYAFAQRLFVYLPLMHSEKIEAQDTCVVKTKELGEEEAAATGKENGMVAQMALDHRAVVAKFGRFPHRNAALGRESTPEELEWLSSDDLPGWAKSQSTG